MLKAKTICCNAGVTLLILPFAAFAQQGSPSLDQILDNASAETVKYVDTFKNLVAEESKIFEIYDKKGEVKKKTAVRSTFIVYQLTKDQNKVVEFRNILSVNGKLIENVDRRAQDFFDKIVRSESSRKEIDQLKKESSRYDGDLVISGLTLFQSPVLSPRLRPFFDFKFVGETTVDGVSMYEVSYQQVKTTPLIKVNAKDTDEPDQTAIEFDIDSDVSGELDGRLSGTLWVDPMTFHVRREHRELTVRPEGTVGAEPVIINDFDFQKSDFGILTPSKITHLQCKLKLKGKLSVKEMRVTMEYSNFSKPDVEIKSSEVRSPKP